MRSVALFIGILTACLWGQTVGADIYVWIDENGVKNFTNQNAPPHAQVFMRIKEKSDSEKQQELLQAQAALREQERRVAQQQAEVQRRVAEAERRTEAAQQAQAEIRKLEARLAEQQAKMQRRIADADRRAQAALQRAGDLQASANDRRDAYRGNTASYGHYRKPFRHRHYRSFKHHYRSHVGIGYHKFRKSHKKHRRFKRHRFSRTPHLRKPFKGSGFHRGGPRKKFETGRHAFRKRHFKSGNGSRFRHRAGGRFRSYGRHRPGFRPR